MKHTLDLGHIDVTSTISQSTLRSVKPEQQDQPTNLPIKTVHTQKAPTRSLAAISQFDELPDCAFVRQPVVLKLFACSKGTLWRWVKISRVPSPHKLSERMSAWNVGQLRQALREISAPGKINTFKRQESESEGAK